MRRIEKAAALFLLGTLAGGCGERPAGGERAASDTAGSAATVGAAAAPADLLASHELVDLTHAFDENTVYWPTSPSRFRLDTLSHGETEGGWFYSAFAISAPEHGGTHLDAPVHFAEGGATADEVELERLIGPAVVIDVSAEAQQDRDFLLGRQHIEAWEAEHGRIPDGAIVLLRTGWDRFWPNARTYLGSDRPGDASDLHFPGFAPEAARFLTESRAVSAVGIDAASIDHGPSRDFAAHRILAAAGVPALENLAGLDRLPATGATLIALPIKVAGGSGGPVRAVALVPRR